MTGAQGSQGAEFAGRVTEAGASQRDRPWRSAEMHLASDWLLIYNVRGNGPKPGRGSPEKE